VAGPERRFAIVFDFDGTILPATPWDSEQTLLLARLEGSPRSFPPAKRLYFRFAAYADRKGWLGEYYKRHYLRLLRGTESGLLDRVASLLAERISPETRRTCAALRARGHRLILASCGTLDLAERILRASGILHYFEALLGNRFVFSGGAIAGMSLSLPSAKAKLEAVRTSGLKPESTVAVGDGPTDLPLLAWAGVPVVMAADGAKWARRLPPSCAFIESLPQILAVLRRHGG